MLIKFSDPMILALVFPNMIGLFILFPEVKETFENIWRQLKNKKSFRELNNSKLFIKKQIFN